jgi:hypothetical protein
LKNHDKPTKAVMAFGFYHSEQPPFMRAATETGPPVMKLGYEKLCASVYIITGLTVWEKPTELTICAISTRVSNGQKLVVVLMCSCSWKEPPALQTFTCQLNIYLMHPDKLPM